MKMLMEDIKNKQFKNIYLLTGEEVYLRMQYRKKLKEALVEDGDTMNVAIFSGKGTDPKEIIDLAETMPFFAEHRVILIDDSGFTKNACPELADYVAQIPESTCIILNEAEVDKRGKLYKAIKSKGRVVEFERQDERTLMRWVLTVLKKEGRNITEDTMKAFLGRTGADMENISKELEKLICYTMGQDTITTEDVYAVCTEQTENRIFEMIQSITEKNRRKAMDLYEDLLTLKEPPMRILFLIARQFNQLLQVKELMAKGMDKGTIASKLKMQPFVVGKTMPQARQFSREQILSYVNSCVETEEAVKSGRLQDRLAVELLITKEYG